MPVKPLPRFFSLRDPTLWGDLGDVLISGCASSFLRRDGLVLLERTGPFLPPISLPIDLILVSDEMRKKLAEEFPALEFRPVIKEKIVELHWEKWDWAKEPEIWPDGPAPDDYINLRPHCPETAERLGNVWEVVLHNGVGSTTIPTETWRKVLCVQADTWDGSDFLWTTPHHCPFAVVSQRAKEWLERECPKWVAFDELRVE